MLIKNKIKTFILLVIIMLCATDFAFDLHKKPYLTKNILDVDYILVEKARRTMTLYNQGRVVKEYKISLGSNPIGHKKQEGDNKTPEGVYYIIYKNPKSTYHLSLKISYPNKNDINQAQASEVSPGDFIMIHGIGSARRNKIFQSYFTNRDWTKGCIAVTNEEIEEIYHSTNVGTTVEIKP